MRNNIEWTPTTRPAVKYQREHSIQKKKRNVTLTYINLYNLQCAHHVLIHTCIYAIVWWTKKTRNAERKRNSDHHSVLSALDIERRRERESTIILFLSPEYMCSDLTHGHKISYNYYKRLSCVAHFYFPLRIFSLRNKFANIIISFGLKRMRLNISLLSSF